MPSLLIKNIKCLYGILENNYALKKGTDMAHVQSIDNAYLFIADGLIHSYGNMDACPEIDGQTIDASGSYVLPGWCDSHTHIVYAASREDEFVYRLKGMTYAEIAEKGGGILNSAKKMADIDEDTLYKQSAGRLENIIKMGTVAVEIKSGYGLTTESELKMLRVIKRLKENHPIHIKSTFLGAHAIPTEYKENREGYIDLLINEMLPIIAKEKLADYIDVFCDKGFYTVEETDRILKAGISYGLKPKIHANELAISGGVQVGIANGAISVDHLEEIGQDEIMALLHSKTIPTVLPSCSYFLNIPYAPVRKMIANGLGVCIGSDYNPGTTPSGNIPFLLSLACTQMKLLPEEAFNAVTINGANAMEIQEVLGSISIGKIGSVIITKPIPSFAYLPYAFGDNHIKNVIVNGNIF
jgi:imidazolonepropionase